MAPTKFEAGHKVIAAIENPKGEVEEHNAIVIKLDGPKVRLEVDLGGYRGRLWTTVDASCVKEVLKAPKVPQDQLLNS